jgi:hypothetical protein
MNAEPQIEIDLNFYSDHAILFEQLLSTVTWDESMTARKTASFGHPYNYSNMRYSETPIPECMVPG